MEGEEHQRQSNQEESTLIARYLQLKASRASGFFDVEEFSAIISHYMEVFDLQEAQRALHIGLNQHPGSLDLTLNQAYLLLYQGKADECLKLISGFEILSPSNEDIIQLKAQAYSQRGDTRKCIHLLEKLLLNKPSLKPRVLGQLAECYVLEDKYLDAIGYWTELHHLSPSDEAPLLSLLQCYEMVDLLEEAQRFFSSVCDAQPYNALAWMQLADTHIRLEQYELAIDAYGYVLAIEEENPIAKQNMALCHFHLDDYHTAISLYTALSSTQDGNVEVLCGLGECYEQLEDYKTAKLHFMASLEYDQGHCESRLGLAICHEHLEESTQALCQMETVVGLEPDSAEYWFIYAEFLARAERLEKSQIAFERAIQLSDGSSEYILGQIDALLRAKELKRALDKVQSAFEIVGDTPEVYYRGIRTLGLLGQRDEAIVLLEMLVERHQITDGLVKYYPDIFEDQSAREFLNSH